jgi:hypothetical protein
VITVPPAIDEMAATIQFLIQAKRQGRPFWRTFWRGGELPRAIEKPIALSQESGGFAGVSAPWNLVASVLAGIVFILAPGWVAMPKGLANFNFLAGALVITVGVVATAELARALRFVNALLGAAAILAPLIVTGAAGAARGIDLALGLVLIGLSLPRGAVHERYGRWQRFIV